MIYATFGEVTKRKREKLKIIQVALITRHVLNIISSGSNLISSVHFSKWTGEIWTVDPVFDLKFHVNAGEIGDEMDIWMIIVLNVSLMMTFSQNAITIMYYDIFILPFVGLALEKKSSTWYREFIENLFCMN